MGTQNFETGWGATNAQENPSGTKLTDGVSGAVSDAVDSAKQTAGQVGEHLRQQVVAGADQQRETAAVGLASLADAVRRMGDGLKNQDQTPVTQVAAHYGESLAEQMERAATYLRQRDTGAIVADLESLARRHPATFLSGAFLLGLLGSRFLKSTRPAPELMYGMPDPKRALPAAGYSVQGSGSWPTSIPQSELGRY